MAVTEKRCSECRATKPASAFHRNRARYDGLDHLCRDCKRAQNAAQYAKHQDERKAKQRQRDLDPDYRRRKWQRRRERLKANGGSHTWGEWVALCDRYGWKCLACGVTAPRSGWLTQDHVIPVSKGGTDDISNIQPLCRPCNERKGQQIRDFRPQQEQAADD